MQGKGKHVQKTDEMHNKRAKMLYAIIVIFSNIFMAYVLMQVRHDLSPAILSAYLFGWVIWNIGLIIEEFKNPKAGVIIRRVGTAILIAAYVAVLMR